MASPSLFNNLTADRLRDLSRQSQANPTQMGSIPGWPGWPGTPGSAAPIAGTYNFSSGASIPLNQLASGDSALNYDLGMQGLQNQMGIAQLQSMTDLERQALINSGNLGVTGLAGQYNLAGQQTAADAQRYGFDAQRDIAGIQGQNQLAVQNAINSGQLGLANVQGQFGLDQTRLQTDAQRDIAGIQQQGQRDIAGIQQQGETTRGLMDNLGADYRTGLGAQAQLAASTYAPQLQSDRFGAVLNGIAAPLMESWFGIQPGTPYQTRDAPQLNLGSGPNYTGAMGVGAAQPVAAPAASAAQPAPQRAPAPQPATASTAPPRQPAAAASQQPRGVPSNYQPYSGGPNLRPPPAPIANRIPAQFRQPPAPARQPQPQQPPARQPQPQPRPAASLTSSPAPSVQYGTQGPQQPGKATTSGLPGQNQPDAMKPLPTSYGGPQITQGPVMGQGMIQAQVGRQQANNAIQASNQNRNNERRMAASGFSSASPQSTALRQQTQFARNFADQEAATQIPAQYAQMNAQHRLASQLGASNVYGQRAQEELARRGQASSFQQGILGWLSSLMG